MAGEPVFSTVGSIIIFLFTEAIGYMILLGAYAWNKRLREWYKRDSFDKALQCFLVGGFVSSFVIFNFTPPLTSSVLADWLTWLSSKWISIVIWEANLAVLMLFAMIELLKRLGARI